MMKLKYLYKGTTLRKYCKEHNLNYDTVVKRIKNKKMSIEQAMTTPKMNKSYLLCSDGVPLIKKCNTISEYRACLWRIKNYNKTVDESLTPINKGRARAEIALRSLWCIELLEDNMMECRQRVKDIFAYYGWTDLPFDEVFEKQFLIGDSLKIMKQWEKEEKEND